MKIRHLVWLRRIIQTFFLCLFLYLLVESRLSQDIYIDYSIVFSGGNDIRLDQPVTFFFKLNPLVGLTSLLSGHHLIPGFLWGLGVLFITIFLGRVFCSFICPFGTIHHAIGSLRPALKGERMIRANQKTPKQKIKYFTLVFLLIGAAIGLNLSGLMDPIALLFRSVAMAVLPGLGTGLRLVFEAMANSDIKAFNLISYGAEVLLSPVFGYNVKAYQTAWFIGLIFFIILFLNRIRGRFWCRILCPLGALMGIFSRVSLLKLKKYKDKCTNCNLCVKHCQGAASPHPDQVWEAAECLACFNCHNICPEQALAFSFSRQPKLNQKPDIGRRAVLGGILAGFSVPLLGRLDGRMDKVADFRLIRPPGSMPEKDFLKLCQRCGLCMKVCPTNAINPTLGEAGMAGFWTPRLIMTQGYCEYTCSLCGSVCPTGAIAGITTKEKINNPIKIGSAYMDRGRCLPWSGNAPCIVCEEVCPTSPKAIYLKKETVSGPGGKKLAVQLPFVDLKQCVGCGICENKCPVKGLPAIRTISAGESRSLENQILL
ncbi:MAG: 4Fe-4S dicluster domain-containing protein [Deltaproteobacteria bacterium]|nr:4Fe-4S dicluster domain-containing protein [Deltaproteobacteria bacterium]